MKQKKSKPKLNSDWMFFMETNGCKGEWPAAYYMDDLHFWPCGKISEEKCDCELCADMAQDKDCLKLAWLAPDLLG